MEERLGLIIRITNNGVQNYSPIDNKDKSWVNSVPYDLGEDVKVLEDFVGTGKTVYLAKFLGSEGYLIALIKAEPKGSTGWRSGDNTTAWIHVPAKCDISNIEIINILDKVKEAITAPKRIDDGLLEKVFAKTYPTNDVLLPAVSTIVSNNNAGYGIRYYNEDFSREDLFGNSIAQQEYSNYKGIFFVDATSGIKANCEELNFKPKKICRYEPPIKDENGFEVYIESQGKYVLFDKQIEVPEGTEVSIRWKKAGYAPVHKSFKAEATHNGICPKRVEAKDCRIIVRRSIFRVLSAEDGSPIPDFEVCIEDKKMDGDYMKVPEADLERGVSLHISAEGYQEYNGSIKKENIFNKETMGIKIEKEVNHYEFKLPILIGENDGKAPITISSEVSNNDVLIAIETKQEVTESPIEGYSVASKSGKIRKGKGNVNTLSCNIELLKLKYFGIGIGSCVLAIFLWAVAPLLFDYASGLIFGQKKQAETEAVPKTPESEENVNTDSLNAVAYLEKNNSWHKDSLDRYDATHGLYEELNDFDKEAITQRKEKLGEVQKLNKIIKAFQDGYDYSIDEKFNSLTNYIINVDRYIEWISQKHPNAASSPQSPAEPSGGIKPPTREDGKGKDAQNPPQKEEETNNGRGGE